MKLFKRIIVKCRQNQSCRDCSLFLDRVCLLQRPPAEWNKHEIKKALRKEK